MLISGATLPDGEVADLRIEGETIAAVGDLEASGEESVLDASGLRVFPGAIDVHVHFREPGASHKETWATGSRSAAAGGVTTVVDQPNTDPPTVTGAAFDAKAEHARDSVVDYGLNGGVTEAWDPDSLFERPLFALGEVFLADSTGDMGIDLELFEDAVERAGAADVPVTVHAEDASLFDEAALEAAREAASEGAGAGGASTGRDADADAWSAYRTPEAEVAAVERAVDVAAEAGAQLHVAHASTPEGIDRAADAGATCEVTPHHCLLSRADLDDLGTFGRMNPPLRSPERREAVFDRLRDGTVDVVATDHAPHTRAEKEAMLTDAPSGVPGVETMLPLLLAAVEGELASRGIDGHGLTHERVRDLVAATPAEIFGLESKGRIEAGRDADLVLFDPDATSEIRGEALHSTCEWTPFEGWPGVFPLATLVRGQVAYASKDERVSVLREQVERRGDADDPFGSERGANVSE